MKIGDKVQISKEIVIKHLHDIPSWYSDEIYIVAFQAI
jgi:hypothetical protein